MRHSLRLGTADLFLGHEAKSSCSPTTPTVNWLNNGNWTVHSFTIWNPYLIWISHFSCSNCWQPIGSCVMGTEGLSKDVGVIVFMPGIEHRRHRAMEHVTASSQTIDDLLMHQHSKSSPVMAVVHMGGSRIQYSQNCTHHASNQPLCNRLQLNCHPTPNQLPPTTFKQSHFFIRAAIAMTSFSTEPLPIRSASATEIN